MAITLRYLDFSAAESSMPQPNEEPILKATSLSCGYHGHAVLAGIDLCLHRGETILLLGPNGVGKSTLMKTLIGALSALSGSVSLEGTGIEKWEPQQLARTIAYVPQQEPAYYPFTVQEFVLMGRLPYAKGMFESDADFMAAEKAMELSECQALADRPVTELSGGEQQRVLLARALAQEPKVLALDEPSSHLDIAHSYGLLETLEKLADLGTAIIAAVHDLNWAARIRSRCYLLGEAGIMASGETRQILKSPQISRCYGREIEAIEVLNGTLVLVPK